MGIVGRLAAFKGQHVFLEAAALVSRRRADVRFVVVGGPASDRDRDYPDRLRRLALNLGLSGRLQFAGHQSDVVPWLNALDVAVHATDGEPFGLVLVEAMLLGTPVVATNLGGPAEILEHERSGWLVPPGRPHATAEAILAILGDSSLREQLSAGRGPPGDGVHRGADERGVCVPVRTGSGPGTERGRIPVSSAPPASSPAV